MHGGNMGLQLRTSLEEKEEKKKKLFFGLHQERKSSQVAFSVSH